MITLKTISTIVLGLAFYSWAQAASFRPGDLKVEDFGAKGDGVSNDSLAILKAIEQLANSPEGTTLHFQDTTYRLDVNGHPEG